MISASKYSPINIRREIPMKMYSVLAVASVALTSVTLADSGCKPSGCGPDRSCVNGCRPVVKKVDLKKTCFKIETKTICIPPTRFPWDSSPCDSVCGNECGQQGSCGSSGRCGAGCGTARACEEGGLFSGLRKALGMENCPRALCVKKPVKSSKKIGEICVCDWECDDICPTDKGCQKPGCCRDENAPPASTPASSEPEIAPAPPETARSPGRFLQTRYYQLRDLID